MYSYHDTVCKERCPAPEEVVYVDSFVGSDCCGFFTNSGSTVALVHICTNEFACAFVVSFSHVSLPAFFILLPSCYIFDNTSVALSKKCNSYVHSLETAAHKLFVFVPLMK